MKDFKDNRELREKLKQLVAVLDAAQHSSQPKNSAFFANVIEISENISAIQNQVDKYFRSNALKQKTQASGVRHKLKSLQFSIAF